MSAITVRFDTSDIWTECKNHHIDPNNQNRLDGWAVDGSYLTVYDSGAGFGGRTRTQVLVSPELNNKTIARLLTSLKENQISCGFSLDDALFYERVIVVDPDGDFPQAGLIRLMTAGITVESLTGPEENFGDELANLLAS